MGNDVELESLYFKLTKQINFDVCNRVLTMFVCDEVNGPCKTVNLTECHVISCSVCFPPFDFKDETETVNTGYQIWQSFEDVGVVNSEEYNSKIDVFHSLYKMHSVNYNCYIGLDWTEIYAFSGKVVLNEHTYKNEAFYTDLSKLDEFHKQFLSDSYLLELDESLKKVTSNDVLDLNICILQCRLYLTCNNAGVNTNIAIEQLYNFTYIDLVVDRSIEKLRKIQSIFVCDQDQITSFVYDTLQDGQTKDFSYYGDAFRKPSVGATVCIKTTHEVLFISAGRIIIDNQAYDITSLSEGNYMRRHLIDYPNT